MNSVTELMTSHNSTALNSALECNTLTMNSVTELMTSHILECKRRFKAKHGTGRIFLIASATGREPVKYLCVLGVRVTSSCQHG